MSYNDDNSDMMFSDDKRDNLGRRLFSAICSKCGSACEVPFHPTPGRDVFCKRCWVDCRGNFGDKLKMK